ADADDRRATAPAGDDGPARHRASSATTPHADGRAALDGAGGHPVAPYPAAKLALRATALATPLFLAACAIPSGGLFRSARFRDIHVYRQYGDALLAGHLPYRDFLVEYPPGAV